MFLSARGQVKHLMAISLEKVHYFGEACFLTTWLLVANLLIGNDKDMTYTNHSSIETYKSVLHSISPGTSNRNVSHLKGFSPGTCRGEPQG